MDPVTTSVWLLLLTSGVTLASSSTATNEYYVGFFYHNQENITLFITTTESVPVPFTVSSSRGQIYSGTATNSVASQVTLSSSFAVVDNTVRDKGVWIWATEASRKITVHGMIRRGNSADGFVALPCIDYQKQNYTYYAVSTYFSSTRPSFISQVLLIGCENNTELTITPTQTVEIPADLMKENNSSVNITSGDSYTVTLNRFQTLLLASTLDLTSSKVVSNKPISFFSGHECAEVPVGVSFCDHLVEQLPPTITWGRQFFVASSLNKTSGEQYKLITSTTTTTVVNYCYTTNESFSQTFTTTRKLNGAGSSYEFHIPQNMFCSIQASNPVLLVQFAIGASREPSQYGDPFMMMIPPVEQYSNNYTFATQSGFQNAITVTVTSEFFNAEDIVLNGNSLNSAYWTEIYCSTQTVCGYGTQVSLSVGQNFIYHRDPTAKLGTNVYGFMRGRSYGYPAGMQLASVSVGCGIPVAPQNGSLDSFNGTTEGSEVFYTCNPGLVPRRMKAVCTENGWFPNPVDLSCTRATPSTTGNEFYVGFFKLYRGLPFITLFITTTESVPVDYTVSSSTGLIYSGTATNNVASQVTLSSSFAVVDNTVRDKGVWIWATEASRKITVHGMIRRGNSADGFVALPYIDYQKQNYTYYAVSTYFNSTTSSFISQVLLIGCENNTELTITPTQTVEIPADLMKENNSSVNITSGDSYTVTLNRFQTLLLASTLDLTSSKVVSNKPISFFSGHECAEVPVGVSFCDHLVEQLPPTITWGRQFFVASSLNKTSGEQYKLITSTTTTTVVNYCYTTNESFSQTFTTTRKLNGTGSSYEFHIPQNMFCSIQASNPVLLVQFAIGASREPSQYGDPFMMMIPPVEQYSNNYTFATQSGFQNAITVTVTSEFFNAEDIVLNGNSLNSAYWTEIYCSTQTVCGYGTRVSLSVGQNFIYHRDPTAKLGTFVYGFMRGRSYGYPAGMQLASISGDCGPPAAPRNGSLEIYTSTAAGSVVFYSCDPGLVPNERMRAVCIKNEWNPNPANLYCSVATTGTTVVAPDVHSQPTPTIVIEETPLDSATQPVATECAVPQRSTQFALGVAGIVGMTGGFVTFFVTVAYIIMERIRRRKATSMDMTEKEKEVSPSVIKMTECEAYATFANRP